MDKILNLNNVDLYNQIYGLETLHPLVTVIDLNKATRQMTYTRCLCAISEIRKSL